MPPEDKKDKAATNRLLDLLRAQQAGASEASGNESGTIDVKEQTVPETPEPKETPQSKSDLLGAIGKPEKPAAPIADAPEDQESAPAETEPETTGPEPPAGDDQADLKARLNKLAQAKPKTVESTSEDTETETPSHIPELARPEEPEPESPEPPAEPAVKPSQIDMANFQTLEDLPESNKAQDLMADFQHWFLENGRLLTVFCSDRAIRVMKIRLEGTRQVIESAETYGLPFQLEDRQILQREELLDYILELETDKKWRKSAYTAFHSTKIESQTKVFTPPQAKAKELKDLITWSAKKNLTFDSENAIYNSEMMLEEDSKNAKPQYAIAIANGESIERVVDVFGSKKYSLRLVGTLPYLIWKLFKQNYPDRNKGVIGLVHIGDTRTTVSVLKHGRLQFTREMQVGVQDYVKAVQQRMVIGERSFTISAEDAEKYTFEYGIPEDKEGTIGDTGISLYKIAIFQTPVIERMRNEINRSLDSFRKQDPELDCRELYFTGQGAAIPNLVEKYGEELSRHVFHLNPFRQNQLILGPEAQLSGQDVPAFSANLALAARESRKLNLLPSGRLEHFRFRLMNKIAALLAIILLPIYLSSGIMSYLEIQRMTENVSKLNESWTRLSGQAQEYFAMVDDLEILSSYTNFLKNDRLNTYNQLKILRLFSTEVPNNIRLTSIAFRHDRSGAKNDGGATLNRITSVDVSGFVEAQPGIADIQLTNFIMQLEGLNVFDRIERENRPSAAAQNRLFFTLEMKL